MSQFLYKIVTNKITLWICILCTVFTAIAIPALFITRENVLSTSRDQVSNLTELELAEAEFNRAYGYGGFIHNFKNYVLRGDKKYRVLAKEKYQKARQTWAMVAQRLQGFDKEKQTIAAMLNAYGNALSIAETTERIDPYLFDQKVRVADAPANDALDKIHSFIIREISRAEQSRRELEIRVDLAISGSVFLLLISVFGLYLNHTIRAEIQITKMRERKAQAKLADLDEKVSELKSGENILRIQHKQAEELGGFGTWLLNLETSELVWSQGIFAIHDRNLSEGLPSLEEAINYYSKEDSKKVNQHIRRASRNKTGFTFEYNLVTKNGKIKHVVSMAEYTEYQGRPFLVGIFRDMTSEAARETAFKKAVKNAERLAKARSDFLAVMSHEIRTPINGMMGVMQLLETMQLPVEASELLEMGMNSGNLLMAIINDLLEMSRLQSGKVNLIERPFNIGKMVVDAVDLHAIEARKKGLVFNVAISEHSPPILFGDEVRLKQIIGNLVSNAIKFTLSGSVSVSVDLSEISADNDVEVTIEVADTGIGIPYQKITGLFEPFEQVEDPYRRQFGGTGLGLSICKSLVELMGGALDVVSKEGQGSTFTTRLRLPVAHSEPDIVDSPEDVSELNKLRVLVVEDIELNAQLMRKALVDRLGMSVTFANNGQEAVDICITEHFDVILMDIQMPVLDGISASKIIRSTMVHHRDTPIIAVTANVLREDMRQYYDAGMQHCITKPIDWREVTYVLKNLDRLKGRENTFDSPENAEWIHKTADHLLVSCVDEASIVQLKEEIHALNEQVASITRGLDAQRNHPSALVTLCKKLRDINKQYGLDLLTSSAEQLETSVHDPISTQRISVQLREAFQGLVVELEA